MIRPIVLLIILALSLAPVAQAGPVLDVLQQELERSQASLARATEAPLFFLQYAVTERHTQTLTVTDGALEAPDRSHQRTLDVDLRVGSMDLDNTHEIREGSWADNASGRRVVDFPLADDAAAMRTVLWNETEYQFRKAQERYTKVVANRQVKVEEEDKSADFSTSSPQRYEEPFAMTVVDSAHWLPLLKQVAAVFTKHSFVQESSARLAVTDQNVCMVNSDGSRLEHSGHYLRVALSVSGTAPDGMVLERDQTYDARTPDGLPSAALLLADAERLVNELDALMKAPIVQPYIGPAVLRNRAAGVFFHEIFGHRIEGHRQKSESEGQTFTKKVGEQILPAFISVYDDPTLVKFKDVDLRGHYRYDDEGVAAQRVPVVENGVLKNFLTSRSPIDKFPASNGHGRREYGREVVSRQGNLIIQSEKTIPAADLRAQLIAECKKQGKPYGLIFEDIAGGFTMTERRGPQAFKVQPLLVYRVYADGRPDEVVRGVDVVGTPLTSFSKIITAGDDDAVFNGTCGAESGWVPVSAVSPSLLVSEIEVEKRQKEQEKPPILPPPRHDPAQ